VTRDQALDFALAQRPESIGVGRLCQELLADFLDEPITAPTPKLHEARTLQRHAMTGNRNNPWGRKGKPK